jgi:hypothetical protein
MNGETVARIGAAVLSERGVATLISLILIGAFLWLGWQLVSDMKAFQQQMLLEAARTNEQLTQLQITHAQMSLKMDRIERLLIEKSGP